VEHLFATRDHETIRQWAEARGAQPATGERTASGPANTDVRDGGSGLRFNFPAASRFRPINWEEWFAHFDAHALVFVYADERHSEIASRAFELWQRRGGGEGDDLRDWFRAERESQSELRTGANRYHITRAGDSTPSGIRTRQPDETEPRR